MSHDTSFNRLHQNLTIPLELAGTRLDQGICSMFTFYSRTQVQKWLKQGDILINNEVRRPKYKLTGGEDITFRISCLRKAVDVVAEKMLLNIVYEDDDIIIINKPAGLIVHPGAGNTSGTLLNGLLAYNRFLGNVPRAGIVHRLDKDTSGLMMIAKNLKSYHFLVSQLSDRSVTREYEAIATGNIENDNHTIRTKIGRSPYNRVKMSVLPTGKDAITHLIILERYRGYTRARCKLETGRTHQIRVHMNYIKSPLLGDKFYNYRLRVLKGTSAILEENLRNFKRQALHACKLTFLHPKNKKNVSFKADLPDDMRTMTHLLREDAKLRDHQEH